MHIPFLPFLALSICIVKQIKKTEDFKAEQKKIIFNPSHSLHIIQSLGFTRWI